MKQKTIYFVLGLLLSFSFFSAQSVVNISTAQASGTSLYLSDGYYLASGTQGVQYSTTVNFVYDGSNCVTISVTGLPTGLTLEGVSAGKPITCAMAGRSFRIVGTPTQSGSYNPVVTISDNDALSTTQTLFLDIASSSSASTGNNSGTSSALQIITGALPVAIAGQPYSYQLQATGGVAPYTWSPVSTTYPTACCIFGVHTDGLFDTQTSSVVPATNIGSFSWVFKVTDAVGNTATKTVYLGIVASNSPIVSQPVAQPLTTFALSQNSVNFLAYQGDTGSQTQLVYLTNTGSTSATFSVSLVNAQNWLKLGSPTASSVTAIPGGQHVITLTADPGNLSVGTYTAYVSISGNFSNSTLIMPVTFTIRSVGSNPALTSSHSPGQNVVTPDGTVYRITSDNHRMPYTSAGAFLSYSFNSWSDVAQATAGDMALPVATYSPSGTNSVRNFYIQPRNGSLINDNGTIYLITNGLRVGFSSAQIFTDLGYSFQNVIPGDTSFLVTLAPINSSSITHPEGTIINDNGTLYLIRNNVRLGFPSMTVFYSWGYRLNEVVPANNYDRLLPRDGAASQRQMSQLNI